MGVAIAYIRALENCTLNITYILINSDSKLKYFYLLARPFAIENEHRNTW